LPEAERSEPLTGQVRSGSLRARCEERARPVLPFHPLRSGAGVWGGAPGALRFRVRSVIGGAPASYGRCPSVKAKPLRGRLRRALTPGPLAPCHRQARAGQGACPGSARAPPITRFVDRLLSLVQPSANPDNSR